MKRTMTRLAAAFLAAVLSVTALGVTAFADVQPCKTCAKEGLTFTGFVATTEFQKVSETQCARVYQCNNDHKQLTYNEDGSYRDVSDHAATKNATCTEAAVCGNCGETFGAPLGHQVVTDQAVAATCTKTGLTEGKHCSRCAQVLTAQTEVPKLDHVFDSGKKTNPTCFKEGFTTYTCKVCGTQVITDKVKPMSHWYAEWQPAGQGQNSAPCKRTGCTYTKTTACADWDFKLVPADADKAESFTVCPVCGQLSDGGRLEMVEDVKTTPITAWTPEGDLLFRAGSLENGEKIICVSFEFDARLTQCYGNIKFTVPAELVEGSKVMLLDADGGETELEVESNGKTADFALNFNTIEDGHRTPVRMLHLVPVSE